MKSLLSKTAIAAAVLGLTLGTALANDHTKSKVDYSGNQVRNPYSPAYGHPYRHGVIPHRAVHEKMKQWEKANATKAAATGTETLSYGGGTNSSNQGNVGVVSSKVKVYLVFYGSQWGTQGTDSNGNATFSGDPDGGAPVAQMMFKGIGTGSELWSADLTQWCDGPNVSSGAVSCPSNASFVPYQSGGVLSGVWEDNTVSSPATASGHQLALEAIKAAQHFGNTTAASNRYAYYVILSPHGTNPDNYQGQYCAWHDWNGDTTLTGGSATSSVGDLAFSNQPYNMDSGAGCGVGFVNSPGTLDGWTMTLGHEWHETMSDQFPAGGWTNQTGSSFNGQENSDECAWIAAGSAGGAANIIMGTGTFTEQASWSNDTNNCAISHAIVGGGGGNATPTATNGSVSTAENTAVNGSLSASDTDGDSLSFAVVANPAHGTVTINNLSTGAFTYTPATNYTGSDSFTFKATDSAGNASNTATESVTVTSTVNATPTANNDSVSTNQNTAVNGTLSASDTDGDALSFAVVTNPAHGTVTINNLSTGAFTYTPATGYSGSDSFTFHATDSAGNVSNTATESVTVNPVSTGGCPTGYTKYTGNITQGNDVYEPNNTYYHTSVTGVNSGLLSGPSGTDYDLYLYKWNSRSGWQVVGASTGSTSSETINYNGTSGYYEWDIYAYSGSGSFQLCLKHP
ncbi:MAG TPA: Ig-like domain-containing protein [Gammaproteobacteria bacterium]|jgi:serine protease|nr:Ig-like domain-containing protein [Gammaproteobacteria bacterium]